MIRTPLLLLSLVTFLVVATTAHAEPPSAQLSLRQAVERALARNPLVVESALEVRRTQGMAAGVAGVLVENPLVSLEGGLHRDQQGWTGNQLALGLRLEQPVDLFGQAGTRREAAGGLVEWSRARLALARAEVAARTHVLYVAAQVARARVALLEERLAAARQTAEALQMRVRLGASSDIDLGMAQAEAARAEAALRDSQAMVGRSLLAMRDLLDLPVEAPASPSDGLAAPPAVVVPGAPAELVAHHVALQVVEKRATALDAEIARLERERMPRIALAVSAERPSQFEHMATVGLVVSPALWRRNQGPLAEARVERERADVEQATTRAALERRWAALVEEQTLRRRQLELLETTLQNEESVRTLVRAGWQAGKFDFFRLLLAERSVAESKQARLDLWAEMWSNVIEMNRLLGREP